MPKSVFSLHSEKCGGTTLRFLLAKNYGPGFFLFENTARALVKSHIENSTDWVIHGHMFYGLHDELDARADYITLLRHPVSRVASHYAHIRSRRDHGLHQQFVEKSTSIQRFVQEHRLGQNFMTRRIVGKYMGELTEEDCELALVRLETFLVVGVLDEFAQFVQRCARRLDWTRTDFSIHNTSGKSRETRRSLSKEDAEQIEKYNSFDMLLYDRAKWRES